MNKQYAEFATLFLSAIVWILRSAHGWWSSRKQLASVQRIELHVKAELANLRADISRYRDEDREELRQWINGSFMRAATVQARLDLANERANGLESRIELLER